jgi:hypothetical protein
VIGGFLAEADRVRRPAPGWACQRTGCVVAAARRPAGQGRGGRACAAGARRRQRPDPACRRPAGEIGEPAWHTRLRATVTAMLLGPACSTPFSKSTAGPGSWTSTFPSASAARGWAACRERGGAAGRRGVQRPRHPCPHPPGHYQAWTRHPARCRRHGCSPRWAVLVILAGAAPASPCRGRRPQTPAGPRRRGPPAGCSCRW